MSKYHILMGKRVPVDKYDTDHLLRLILKLSKRCNKFALKNTKSLNLDDGGVWVARGFVTVGRAVSRNGRWELSTMADDPLTVAEKFLTLLTEHEEKYATHRDKLDPTKDTL
jgi:hypothetical protein